MSYLLTNPKRGQNILTTLGQMLHDRGYQLNEPYSLKKAELEQDLLKSQKHYETEECLMTGIKNQETVMVMAPKEDKLAIDTVRKYVEQYDNQKHTHLIIIIQNITPAAKQMVDACKRFELFYEVEVFCNKTHHSLYIPHRGVDEKEEEQILKKYKCEKKNFPAIRRTDPIARYFAWPVGTVVEIKNKPNVEYRVVVDE